jgi:hypothetical protein
MASRRSYHVRGAIREEAAMSRTWKDMRADLRERRRVEWQARRSVRVDRVADDGFGNPAFRLLRSDGSPMLAGLFVERHRAESWARSRQLVILDDARQLA